MHRLSPVPSVLASALLAACLGPVGCAARRDRPDPVRSTLDMPVEPLQSLTVDLSGGVGEVGVRAGCEGLIEGTIDYDAAYAKPEVIFTEQDGHGRLTLRGRPRGGDDRGGGFEWNLCLNGDIPLYVNAHAGVGELSLDLRDSQLRRLVVSAGVGEVHVDLPSPDPSRTRRVVEIEVDGGVGEVDITAPRDAPLRLLASPGVGGVSAPGYRQLDAGQWVSDAWASDVAPRIEVAAKVGVGELTLRQSSAIERPSKGASSPAVSSSSAGTRDSSAENQ